MPYASERQRRYMHARHPDIAARWDAEYGPKVKSEHQPRRKVLNKRRRRAAHSSS